MTPIESVFVFFQRLLGLTPRGLAGLFILGTFSRRTRTGSALTGAVTSALVLCLAETQTNLHGYLYALAGTAVCVIVGYIVKLLLHALRPLPPTRTPDFRTAPNFLFMHPIRSLLLILAVVSALRAAPLLEFSDVFPANSNGIVRHRIPGVVVTPKGTVLAYCEARSHSSSDWGEIEVHLRRSTDGGKTWDAPRQIAHRAARLEGNPRKKQGGDREQTVNNPVAIVDRTTGAIEFVYCVNYARAFAMRSTDDGLTWSDPVDITASFEPFRRHYDWKVIATGPGHGVQLKSGRLVVPIWLAYGATGDHKPSAAGTITSDDHGKTWRAGDIAFPNAGEFGDPNETMITTLTDGRVMLVARNVSKTNRKLVSISADGATGWSTPKFHDQLWEPICMASIVAHPAQPGMQIYSAPHTLGRDAAGKEIPAGRGKRENLSIKLSRDDGKMWSVNKTLDAGPSAYSDLAVLPDGTVLCLYEKGSDIVAARFNLEWLTGPPATR